MHASGLCLRYADTGPQEVAGLLWTFTKHCLKLMSLQILRHPFLRQQTYPRIWEPLTSITDHWWTRPY